MPIGWCGRSLTRLLHAAIVDLLACNHGPVQVETSTKARRKLDKKLKADKEKTDKYYSSFISLRSEPLSTFFGNGTPKAHLPITSINEACCQDLNLRHRISHICPLMGVPIHVW